MRTHTPLIFMTNHEFRDSRRPTAEPLVVGQNVEIRRGLLQGLSGVLVSFGRDGNCLIELDGMNSGILLSIAAASVWQKPANPGAKAQRAGEEPTEMPKP